MALAVGDRFGRLADIMDHGAYHVPPSLPVPDMSIFNSTMRDEVLKSDYRERAKLLIKQEADKSMLYAFISSKLSLESEDEVKRHPNYNNFHVTKNPLELWKALLQLHLTNTVSKNVDFVLQMAENDYMSCNQGEFESITKFKRFDIKVKAYNNALDPTLQVSDKRAAIAFLNKLHRTPYGQFYANKINIINTDATKVPANVNEVYVEAKAYITIVTTNKPNGTPVSFATTAESFLRSIKKKTPRGSNKSANNPKNGSYVTPSTTITPHVSTVAEHHDQASGPGSNPSPNSTNLTGSNNGRDMSRIQCYNCQVFGHYARDCPTKDPLTVMTTGGQSYYQPQ